MMGERFRYELAISTAEVMYALLETEYQREECDLDAAMRRLKDLSAYSLIHAEIMSQREGPELLALAMFFGATSNPSQREGPELLALAMFFGATSNPRYHKNQERIRLLSEETFAYKGQSEIIEQEVAMRKKRASAE